MPDWGMRSGLAIAVLLSLNACAHSQVVMPTVTDAANAYTQKEGEPCRLAIDHPMCDDLIFLPPPAETVTGFRCNSIAKDLASCRFRVHGQPCQARFKRENGTWYLDRERRVKVAVKCRDWNW